MSTNTTHCHRSSLPSMEAKPPAAPTPRGRPPTNYTPMVPKQAVTTGYRCQAREEQLRLPVITHASPQRMKTPIRDPRLRRRGEVAACHHCRAASLHSSSDFTLQNPSPRVDRAPRSKSIHQETSKPRRSPNATPSTRERQQRRRRRTSTMDWVFTYGRRH